MLTIKSRQMLSDLLVLNTHQYDIILGMDWLARNSICIDCAQRHVIVFGEAFPEILPPIHKLFSIVWSSHC